jgi:hypothetical protein
MSKLALVGESYALRSPAAAAQQTLNLIPQFMDDPSERGKNTGILRNCPGYHLMITLPQSPIVGILSGGGNLYLYTGNGWFFQVGLGTYVGGNPSTGVGTVVSSQNVGITSSKPVQMFANGNQVLLIVGGYAYINNGSGFVPCQFQVSGTCSTTGTTTVTWVSGGNFANAAIGNNITINGGLYAVASVISATQTTVTSAPPVLTNVAFSGNMGTQVTAVGGAYIDGYFVVQRPIGSAFQGTVNTSGTAVTWVSGANFSSLTGGSSLSINGVAYFVSSVTSNTAMVLTTSAGTLTGAVTAWGSDLSRQFNISGVFNGLSWSPLDFATKQAYSDHTQSILADREQLYFFGAESLEVWQNVGDPTFPFQRIPGAASREGSIAAYAPVTTGENVYFLGGSPRGPAVAYRLDGFTPVRVSTHAVEGAWASAGDTLSKAVAYATEEDGHRMWVINFVGSLNTWVYDETASAQAGTPIWHQRAYWNGSAFTPYQPRFHTFIPEWGPSGMHVVGDFGSGNLYELNPGYVDANGADTKWQRILPHLYAAGFIQYFGRMTLEMETGTTSSSSVQPLITRDYSDDRGHTFGNPVTAQAGLNAAYSQRVYWPANGSSRDRVFRLSGSGQYSVTLIDLDLEVEKGTT